MTDITIVIGTENNTFDSPDAIENDYKSEESLAYYMKCNGNKEYFLDFEELGYILEKLCEIKE